MSEDLIKRLWLYDCEGITREAADRIEELEAKLAKSMTALAEAIYMLSPSNDDMEKQAGIYRIVTAYDELKGE